VTCLFSAFCVCCEGEESRSLVLSKSASVAAGDISSFQRVRYLVHKAEIEDSDQLGAGTSKGNRSPQPNCCRRVNMGNHLPQGQQAPPPASYIIQDGHIYYQGPALGATGTHQPGKDDILPPAYPVDTARDMRDTRANNGYGYEYGNGYGSGNWNGYGYGYTQQPPERVVVVERSESRATPLVAGAAVGCCLAACCSVM